MVPCLPASHASKRVVSFALPALLTWLLCVAVQKALADTLLNDARGLLAFKAAMGDAPSLVGWRGEDPCGAQWDGVYCEANFVTELHLNERVPKLAGKLPEAGSPFWQMGALQILDLMWNSITGGLPEDIGQMRNLSLLLLNGNMLSGPLPKSLGMLLNIDRIQIDENQFSGPVPAELGDLPLFKHLHFNNNSLSGQIPPELGKLPKLAHLLLDNNNLSGPLPPEIGNISTLTVLQLDNNGELSGGIPDSYNNFPNLRKMSMRNCGLSGPLPSFAGMPNLFFVDLSHNAFTGQLPATLGNKTSTISFSNNPFEGPIPPYYADLPNLQVFYCEWCRLNGSIPPFGSSGYMSTQNQSVINLQRNNLAAEPLPQSLVNGARSSAISVFLYGNMDLCEMETDLLSACNSYVPELGTSTEAPYQREPTNCVCSDHLSPTPMPGLEQCVCAGPLIVGLRLKSPSFDVFQPYRDAMISHIANMTNVDRDQVAIGQYSWEPGPRLNLTVQIFPKLLNLTGQQALNMGPLPDEECDRIFRILYNWRITDTELFGPVENRFFKKPFYTEDLGKSKGLNVGVIVAVVLGCLVAGIILGTVLLFLLYKLTGHPKQIGRFMGYYATKKGAVPWTSTMPKVRGCQVFTHEELKEACNNFSQDKCVGFGAYGHVFKGTLPNGDAIAVKVPDRESWQGKAEFDTEIELLSRVHHRNLVNLVGFCCESNHEALVYEFVPGGTLKQYLQATSKGLREGLPFLRRVIIALESAQAVNYLHTGASPPIIHRDIKTGNILLDKRLHAKVADFGLSKKTRDPYDDGFSRKLSTPPKRGGPPSPPPLTIPELPSIAPGPGPHPQPATQPGPPRRQPRNPDISSIKGTPFYLDPEYFSTRQLTAKSDVYSFGVVLAELATGKPAMFAMERLFDWFDDDEPLSMIVDPNMGSYRSETMHAFLLLSKHCVRDKGEDRPPMADVIRSLEALLQQLPKEAWETPAHSALRASATPSTPSSSSASLRSSALTSERVDEPPSPQEHQPVPFFSFTRRGRGSQKVATEELQVLWVSREPSDEGVQIEEAREDIMDPSSTSFEATGSTDFAKVGHLSVGPLRPR